MNYRHSFHAGNFADLHKHFVLSRVLVRLREKETPFRVLDTHAGVGVYDLTGEDASRTGEWQSGIGKLWSAELPGALATLLGPYLDAVRARNGEGLLRYYPGSPQVVRHLLRANDRLIACELQPDTFAALARLLRSDRRTKAVAIDGWTALSAYIPFRERRGLVVVDPPFEQPREFERLSAALQAAHRKWPTGSYLAWYPIKEQREVDAFARSLARSGIAKVLRSELIRGATPAEGLRGSGLILINPPWKVPDDLGAALPELAQLLEEEQPALARTDWLT
jgi:23S rRNA (adenine2030-N6)-methyltransferase